MVIRTRGGSRQVTGAPPSSQDAPPPFPAREQGVNIWTFFTPRLQLPSGQAQLRAGAGEPAGGHTAWWRVHTPLCLSSLTLPPQPLQDGAGDPGVWGGVGAGAREQDESTAFLPAAGLHPDQPEKASGWGAGGEELMSYQGFDLDGDNLITEWRLKIRFKWLKGHLEIQGNITQFSSVSQSCPTL